MQAFLEAVLSDASGEDIASLSVPEAHRAAFVRRDEQDTWEGVASAIDFNTVWTSIFEPLPTFAFLGRPGNESRRGERAYAAKATGTSLDPTDTETVEVRDPERVESTPG